MSKWRDDLEYPVHPAADVFPMMSDTELAELGADIKKNGLTTPIVFWTGDSGTFLIDGRNRLEAMERAGVLDDDHLVVNTRFTAKTPFRTSSRSTSIAATSPSRNAAI
jgi:hypothetical protein